MLSPQLAALQPVLPIPPHTTSHPHSGVLRPQGGYKMVPLTDPTGERTASLCLQYSVYLALLPPACWAAGVTSCMFAVESVGARNPTLF